MWHFGDIDAARDLRLPALFGHQSMVRLCRRMTQSGLSGLGLTTFASNCDNLARKACKLASKAHIFDTGPPDVGADGKDYRANSVHAPLSGNSQQSSARGFEARGA